MQAAAWRPARQVKFLCSPPLLRGSQTAPTLLPQHCFHNSASMSAPACPYRILIYMLTSSPFRPRPAPPRPAPPCSYPSGGTAASGGRGDRTSSVSSIMHETGTAGSIMVSKRQQRAHVAMRQAVAKSSSLYVVWSINVSKAPRLSSNNLVQEGRLSRRSLGTARRLENNLAANADSYATVQHHGLDVVGVAMGTLSGVFLGLQGVLWGASAAGFGRSLSVFLIAQFFYTMLFLLPAFCCQTSIVRMDHIRLSAVSRAVLEKAAVSKLRVSSCPHQLATPAIAAIVPITLPTPTSTDQPYAVAGALCYSCAQAGQVMGIVSLGVSVGMPLSQLNLVVAGLWSIFYYEEVSSPRLVAIFLMAMLIDVGGAVLLNV